MDFDDVEVRKTALMHAIQGDPKAGIDDILARAEAYRAFLLGEQTKGAVDTAAA